MSSFASGQSGVPDLSSFVRTRVLAAFFVHRPVLCIVCTCGFYATSGRSVFHLQFQRTALVQLLYRLPVPSATQCGTLDRCYLGAKLSHASHYLSLLHGASGFTQVLRRGSFNTVEPYTSTFNVPFQTKEFTLQVSVDRYMLGDA
jgi:hypothetical protein